MKNILRNISWDKFEHVLSATIARFPVAVLGLFCVAIVSIASVNDSALLGEGLTMKIVFTALLGVWLSVTASLGRESLHMGQKHHNLLQIGVLVTAGLYWFTLPGSFTNAPGDVWMVHVVTHVALAISMLFSFVIGEYTRGQYQDRQFYNFLITSGLYAVQAALIAGLLFILGASIIGTVDILFDLSFIGGEEYLDLFIISSIIIAPLYFLSLVPKKLEEKLEVGEKFLHFLIRYISIPFICIYFVILYAYSVKVLLNFSQWPQGEISWLVIWFSFFSYLVYFLSYQLQHERIIRRVRQAIPYLLLPQIAMLFYAIMLRINQHGFTINRYLVYIFGVWLLVLAGYFVYTRTRSRLVFIPASLFVFALIAAFGPWSMFSVAERSQIEHLRADLVALGIIQNGTVRGLSSAELEAIDKKLAGSARSRISYLCQYHGCQSMAELLPSQVALVTDRDTTWEGERKIADELQLPEYYDPYLDERGAYINIQNSNASIMDIKGYSSLALFATGEDRVGMSQTYYDAETEQLVLVEGEKTTRIAIGDQLRTFATNNQYESQTDGGPFTITKEGVSYKVYVRYLNGVKTNDTFEIDFIEGVVLY